MTPRMRLQGLTAFALTTVLTVGLSACGNAEADPTAPSAAPATTESEAMSEQDLGQPSTSVSVSDAWVKAADDGMSAAFGVLKNSGDTPITVVGASTTVAHAVELHETVENADGQMVMRETEGGFVIPAHGEYPLSPGASHFMLMSLNQPVEAGAEVSLILSLNDGKIVPVEATVKDYAGANESYEEGS